MAMPQKTKARVAAQNYTLRRNIRPPYRSLY